MGLITLLTDYKYQDFYLAKIESRIKKFFAQDYLIHISHGVSSFNLTQTAYNFNALLEDFSPDDWHFIFVNLHYKPNYELVIASTKQHGFIVTSNSGLLGLLNCELKSVYKLPVLKGSFVELEILKLCKEKTETIKSLSVLENPNLFREKTAQITEREIKGEIIYIDSYGNCIANITKNTFLEFTKQSPYSIKVRREVIESISTDYSDNQEAGITVFFNEQNYLEVACTHGEADKLIGLQLGSRVSVKKG